MANHPWLLYSRIRIPLSMTFSSVTARYGYISPAVPDVITRLILVANQPAGVAGPVLRDGRLLLAAHAVQQIISWHFRPIFRIRANTATRRQVFEPQNPLARIRPAKPADWHATPRVNRNKSQSKPFRYEVRGTKAFAVPACIVLEALEPMCFRQRVWSRNGGISARRDVLFVRPR